MKRKPIVKIRLFSFVILKENIFSMIHQVFERAILRKPPCGMSPCHRSRAIYAVDLMLDENGQPYLLEMNFMPDIERACLYYPTFIDDIFRTLFLDESNCNVIDISLK
jgi:tubulin--tyrosine ligase-like protein 12